MFAGFGRHQRRDRQAFNAYIAEYRQHDGYDRR